MLTLPNIKLPAKSQWAEYSCRTGKLLIKSAFIFGSLPLNFKISDPKNQYLKHETSRFHRARCIICNLLPLSAFLIIFVDFLQDFWSGKIIFMDPLSSFRVFTIVVSLGCVLLQLHTFWKIDSIVTFLNGCTAYYAHFQGN